MKITLCGSTRFKSQYEALNRQLTLQGHLVYSVACFARGDDRVTHSQKALLDEVHKKKIEASDAIVVINVDGYVGESTMSEIAYAEKLGKLVRFLYPDWDPKLSPNGRHLCPFKGCQNDFLSGPCALCYE